MQQRFEELVWGGDRYVTTGEAGRIAGNGATARDAADRAKNRRRVNLQENGRRINKFARYLALG